jgi:hypothetical protein
MIKYCFENPADITQFVEIDLQAIPEESKKCLEEIIASIDVEDNKVFKFKGRNKEKLCYATEVLIPTTTRQDRNNLLLVVGNPAIHSVADGIPYSYERRKGGSHIEHRFWRALRKTGVIEFPENRNNPSAANNEYKRNCLLSGDYESKFNFNLFILPYFSFPTPASREYNGVAGIKRIVGHNIFTEMKKFEAQRFKKIVKSYEIKNLICFGKAAWQEIESDNSKPVNSCPVGSTILILSAERIDELRRIVSCMTA